MHCYKHANNVFVRVTGEKNANHAITRIEIDCLSKLQQVSRGLSFCIFDVENICIVLETPVVRLLINMVNNNRKYYNEARIEGLSFDLESFLVWY
jgi:hypothetical protein